SHSFPTRRSSDLSVSLWLPLAERSTANGLVTAGALVGIALTYPGFGWLMDRVGWPAAFVICGAALMLFALAWSALAADDPAGHPWANPAERRLVAGGGPAPPRARTAPRDLLRLLRNRGLVLLTLSYGAVGYVQYIDRNSDV